ATLESYVRDEGPALDELRRFVGGQAGVALDGSTASLAILDAFIRNLIAVPDWEGSRLLVDFPKIRSWLAVCVAYYIGRYARSQYGCPWYLSINTDSAAHGTPVMAVNGIEFSPLETAPPFLSGGVIGGLVVLFADLETERLKRKELN